LAEAKERFIMPHNADRSNLLGLAIDQACMPYIEHAAMQVMSHVDLSKWVEGSCPCCGGEPNFAYLEGEDGSRGLVCSRCRFVWRYKRIGCPFCGNTDPGTLRYYPAGKKNTYRLYVCDSCKRYLKAVDQRVVGSSIDLIVEPILTWSLDKAAREKGYL
jgi:FdhE protein